MSKYTRSWTESVRMVAERKEKGVRPSKEKRHSNASSLERTKFHCNE